MSAILLATSLGAFGHVPASVAAPDEPYMHMPEFAPIGVRTAKYLDIPDAARGPAIDPAKGYRIQQLGRGL
jgi:hypothetical protein